MVNIDYNNAVSVLRDTFWVGFYDKEADLHCNPYIIIDDDEVVLIDPGSIPHFSTVMRKIIDIVNPMDISTIIVNHQDPDVCGNMAVVESLIDRKDLKIVMHSSVTRLIRHYGVTSDFYVVDEHDDKLTLGSGKVLEFIHAPYLHSPFALMTYDVKNKTLFSGDLFGAISRDWSLFAKEDFLPPMDAWHRMTMPSSQVLGACMERLEKLDIDRILPQHGSILEGPSVPRAIAHLKNLKCGIDLIDEGPR